MDLSRGKKDITIKLLNHFDMIEVYSIDYVDKVSFIVTARKESKNAYIRFMCPSEMLNDVEFLESFIVNVIKKRLDYYFKKHYNII